MGFLDDVGRLVGRGVNVADKRTQILRLQAELGRIDQELELAFANFGRSVYAVSGYDSTFTSEHEVQIKTIEQQIKRERAVKQQIEELQKSLAVAFESPVEERYRCLRCGHYVTLDSAYCGSCGDNLAELKSKYRLCKICHRYYPADTNFCENCGTKTISIPIAAPIESPPTAKVTAIPLTVQTTYSDHRLDKELPEQTGQSRQSVIVNSIDEFNSSAETATKGAVCPECGAIDDVGGRFCGHCGAMLG